LNLLDLAKFLLALGYPWGIPLLLSAAGAFLLWKIGRYQWDQGRRGIKLVSPWVFWSGIATIAVVCGSSFWYLNYWGMPSTFLASETGILIASIPGDNNRVEQQTYAQAIRRLAYESPDLAKSVRVELIERPLSNDPEAQQRESLVLGRRLHATFVLRAIRVEGGHESWLTIIDQPDFQGAETHIARVSNGELLEIDRLPLPSDVILMARCALAMAEYHRDQYEAAISSLRLILEAQRLPPAAPTRPYLSVSLGNSYLRISSSDPLVRLPLAISAYEDALRTWAREKYPEQWAYAVFDLAAAHSLLPGAGQRVLQESAELMDTAMATFRKTASNEDLAGALINRSNTYRELLGPNRDLNVREAISSADQALAFIDRTKYPIAWAKAMQVRGSAYKELPNATIDDLKEAIHSADLAMAEYKQHGDEHDWALTMNNRGAAFKDEALRGILREANLAEAIQCFEQALEVLTRERYPFEWALSANNLAISYVELPSLHHNEDIRRAIDLFGDSLKIRTFERDRIEWAFTMVNIATAYLSIEGPSRAEALKYATRHCDKVLAVIQDQDDPHTRYAALADRANAYSDVPGPDRVRNLWEAIRSFDLALAVQHPRVANDELGMLMYNRANSYAELGKVEEAIKSYDEALQMASREQNGPEWAMIMHNRGAAYLRLPGSKDENIKEAIRSFDLALAARPLTADKVGWATTMANKGLAFMKLRGNRIESLQQAISCFDLALQVLSPDNQSIEWEITMHNRKDAQAELDRYRIPQKRALLVKPTGWLAQAFDPVCISNAEGAPSCRELCERVGG
jgi:tetratricopeptide (TPR) repeat protein